MPLVMSTVFHIWSAMALVSAQRVFLSSTNLTPCFGDTVDLICHYPDVMETVNEQPRYITAIASYRMNGKVILHDEDVFAQRPINQTASRLRVRIDPGIFTGDPVSFTCFLPLTGGGEDSSSTRLVDPQEVTAPHTIHAPVVTATTIMVVWDHIDRGTCYSHLTFSYNITWYTVFPHGEMEWSAVTEPGATTYNITNLRHSTDYLIQIVGFSSDGRTVYTEEATSNFKTNGSVNTESPYPGSDHDINSTAGLIAGLVLLALLIIFINTFTFVMVLVCTRRIKQTGIYDTEEEGHTDSGKRGGVPGLNTGKTGPAAGHQKEEHTTKHPSDQWQSHYAEIDKNWLFEKRYIHPEQEMFHVTYAVVDRAAMTSGEPPLVKERLEGAKGADCPRTSV